MLMFYLLKETKDAEHREKHLKDCMHQMAGENMR